MEVQPSLCSCITDYGETFSVDTRFWTGFKNRKINEGAGAYTSSMVSNEIPVFNSLESIKLFMLGDGAFIVFLEAVSSTEYIVGAFNHQSNSFDIQSSPSTITGFVSGSPTTTSMHRYYEDKEYGEVYLAGYADSNKVFLCGMSVDQSTSPPSLDLYEALAPITPKNYDQSQNTGFITDIKIDANESYNSNELSSSICHP